MMDDIKALLLKINQQLLKITDSLLQGPQTDWRIKTLFLFHYSSCHCCSRSYLFLFCEPARVSGAAGGHLGVASLSLGAEHGVAVVVPAGRLTLDTADRVGVRLGPARNLERWNRTGISSQCVNNSLVHFKCPFYIKQW